MSMSMSMSWHTRALSVVGVGRVSCTLSTLTRTTIQQRWADGVDSELVVCSLNTQQEGGDNRGRLSAASHLCGGASVFHQQTSRRRPMLCIPGKHTRMQGLSDSRHWYNQPVLCQWLVGTPSLLRPNHWMGFIDSQEP